ncbi:hypothetical protein PO654_16675 [Phytobacter diazotrophicus]|uniref:hypothetical protein n=1 Tax=Phytobacter diazotrophicus TaxID=395631 RepID=UPI0013EAC4E0|nr:hypothetical protein [Phytobacter diazotrophicus]MDU6685339.1 hypothetical protein [Enterobacteriaceae bacterium]QIH65048.1 hypothetical protein CRX67_19260 [Enterobacteriaceae bacterium A-F18]
MKQVTMESVKQRIADLERADNTFGLGLNTEFELACLRELVAVTEQRDALVADNAVLIDLARKFADRADDYKGSLMGFSVFESFNELKSAGSKEATSAVIAALREEATEAAFNSDKHAALCDSAYVSGMQAGWNFGVDEDVTGFQQSLEAYRKPMREACRQLRESKGANHG